MKKKPYLPTIKTIHPQDKYVLVIMSSVDGIIGFVCERQKEREVYANQKDEKHIRFPLKVYPSKEEVNEAGNALSALIGGKSDAATAVDVCEKIGVELEPKPILMLATYKVQEKKGNLSMFVASLQEDGILIHSSKDFYTGKDKGLYGEMDIENTCFYFSYDEYIDMGDKLVELYGEK